MNQRIVIWCFALLGILLTDPAIAAEKQYVLTGRVMDTSDNWLPNVQVALKKIGTRTRTGPNGKFTLKFTLKKPLTPTHGKTIEYLEFEKEGHIKKTISITSMDFFSRAKPIIAKLKVHAIGLNIFP